MSADGIHQTFAVVDHTNSESSVYLVITAEGVEYRERICLCECDDDLRTASYRANKIAKLLRLSARSDFGESTAN